MTCSSADLKKHHTRKPMHKYTELKLNQSFSRLLYIHIIYYCYYDCEYWCLSAYILDSRLKLFKLRVLTRQFKCAFHDNTYKYLCKGKESHFFHWYIGMENCKL